MMSTKISRPVVVAFVSVVLLLTLPASALPDLLDGRPACKKVSDWVVAHAAALPRTLSELSSYPIEYRRVIFDHLTVEQKVKAWRDHLETFMEPGAGLSAVQKAFLEAMRAKLGPATFASSVALSAEDVADRKTALSLFAKTQAGAIFATLGPTSPRSRYRTIASARLAIADDLRNLFTVRAAAVRLSDCTCNMSVDWCVGNPVACTNGIACHETQSGCGWWWAKPCNGNCHTIEGD